MVEVATVSIQQAKYALNTSKQLVETTIGIEDDVFFFVLSILENNVNDGSKRKNLIGMLKKKQFNYN